MDIPFFHFRLALSDTKKLFTHMILLAVNELNMPAQIPVKFRAS